MPVALLDAAPVRDESEPTRTDRQRYIRRNRNSNCNRYGVRDADGSGDDGETALRGVERPGRTA